MSKVFRTSVVALAAALALSTSALTADAAPRMGGGGHGGGFHGGGGGWHGGGGGWHGGGGGWHGGGWHGGGGYYGGGWGWGPGLALGVGAAALAAGAYSQCYARQPTYDNYGHFIGYQNVYVCN